jgi:hypothetical protein
VAESKTQPGGADPAALLAALEPERRRADARALDALFREVTGFAPVIWGDGILGYGRYEYTYASGRSGAFLATGFAPRKTAFSIYIMPGYAEFGDHRARLGKHTAGKACLYVKRLSEIDTAVLADLVRAGLADLGARWPVHPT